jgi:hypothetical protein
MFWAWWTTATVMIRVPVTAGATGRLELEDPRVVLVAGILVGDQLDVTARLRTDQGWPWPLPHQRPVVGVADPQRRRSRLVAQLSMPLQRLMAARLHGRRLDPRAGDQGPRISPLHLCVRGGLYVYQGAPQGARSKGGPGNRERRGLARALRCLAADLARTGDQCPSEAPHRANSAGGRAKTSIKALARRWAAGEDSLRRRRPAGG